jgi:small subunit ribosomal protein S1
MLENDVPHGIPSASEPLALEPLAPEAIAPQVMAENAPIRSAPEITEDEVTPVPDVPQASALESAPAVPDDAPNAADAPDVPAVADGELAAVELGAVNASIEMSQAEAESAGTVTAARDAQLAESRRRATEAWERIVEAHASGTPVLGTIVSSVKGGMLVDMAGIRGFLPASQVRAPAGATLDSLVKTVLPLKILDIDAGRRRAVVSARRAREDDRRRKRADLLRDLQPGQRREVTVLRLTDFGAFVDLGGVDGLIPMSELALERVERASDVLTVGDKLEVEVLRVDENGKKISLSRKNALPDPWRDHAALLRIGNVLEGTVIAKEPRLSIELAPGVVGVMRDSDADPTDYALGEKVEVAIRTVDRRTRRLTLASPYARAAALPQTSGFAPLGQELESRTKPSGRR